MTKKRYFLAELGRLTEQSRRRERAALPRLLEHLCKDSTAALQNITRLRELRQGIRETVEQARADLSLTADLEDMMRQATGFYRVALRDWIKTTKLEKK